MMKTEENSSTTSFSIEVRGKSAHGSTPHLGEDAIVAACAMMLNLQTLISRFNNPIEPLALSLDKVEGGKQFNIICDKVVLTGRITAAKSAVNAMMMQKMEKIAEDTASIFDCKAQVSYKENILGGCSHV